MKKIRDASVGVSYSSMPVFASEPRNSTEHLIRRERESLFDSLYERKTVPERSMEMLEVNRRHQDEVLEDMETVLNRIGNMSQQITLELEKQDEMLEELDVELDHANSRVEILDRKLRRLMERSHCSYCKVILVLFAIFLVLILVIIYL